jgi:hypothetical protein
MRTLDPEDRHLLDAEYRLPGAGADALRINDDDYRKRVVRSLSDPGAALYAKTVIERPRTEYDQWRYKRKSGVPVAGPLTHTKECPVSGGVVTVDCGEVSVSKGGLSITGRGLTVSAVIVSHPCFLVAQGDQVTQHRCIVARSRGAVSPCGGGIPLIGCR